MNSVAEAFSFLCRYSTYSGYSAEAGYFLTILAIKSCCFLVAGEWSIVYACRKLLNALTSAHVLHQIARSGGVPDVPTCKNNLCHTMISDTDRLHQR